MKNIITYIKGISLKFLSLPESQINFKNIKHTKGKIDKKANMVKLKVNSKLNFKIFSCLFLIKVM